MELSPELESKTKRFLAEVATCRYVGFLPATTDKDEMAMFVKLDDVAFSFTTAEARIVADVLEASTRRDVAVNVVWGDLPEMLHEQADRIEAFWAARNET